MMMYVVYGWILKEEDLRYFSYKTISLPKPDLDSDKGPEAVHFMGVIVNKFVPGEVIPPSALQRLAASTSSDYLELKEKGARGSQPIPAEEWQLLNEIQELPPSRFLVLGEGY